MQLLFHRISSRDSFLQKVAADLAMDDKSFKSRYRNLSLQKVIESTNESYISTPAKLKFLYLDLNDLSSIAKI
jgi:hypothetical protein